MKYLPCKIHTHDQTFPQQYPCKLQIKEYQSMNSYKYVTYKL